MRIKQYLARVFPGCGKASGQAEKANSCDPKTESPGEQPTAAAVADLAIGRTWPAFIVAAVITLSFLTFPPPPQDIGTNGDVSWGAVLSHAHEHGLQFGPDIVYTYGPLGFLIQGYYSAHAAGLRMLTDVLVCFTAAAGLCLVAWKLRIWRRVLLLGAFVFAAANLEGRTDLVIDVAFLCWGLLCFYEDGRRLALSACVFTAFTVFAGLAKNSFLFMGGLCVLLIAADLFLRHRRLLALAIPAGFVALFSLGWMAAGQQLRNIPDFLAKALIVVRAYNDALGWEGLSAVRWSGVVLALLSLILITLAALTTFQRAVDHRPWRRALLWTWASLLTFSVWKHSFLREDFRHPAFLLGFTPVLALSLTGLAWRRAETEAPETSTARPGIVHRVWRWETLGAALALFCCLYSLFFLQWLFFATPARSLRAPFLAALNNVRALANPRQYQAKMNEATAACRAEAQLPEVRRIAVDHGVDCFGFTQAYVLFNDLHYWPRPVFQSFVACNDRLTALNEEFFLSPAAPEFVLFSLNPVDRKFPALEDAKALRTLLFNYAPTAAEKQFLLLRRRAWDSPKATLLREGTVRPGEPIDLWPFGGQDLWMEIHLQPSWAGRVRQFLYRAPTVRLAAYREPGKSLLLRRRAPAPMLAAGFLVSPLLTSTADVLDLYKGAKVTRPGACAVEVTPGTEFYWHQEIRFRVFRIENQLGRFLPPDWDLR